MHSLTTTEVRSRNMRLLSDLLQWKLCIDESRLIIACPASTTGKAHRKLTPNLKTFSLWTMSNISVASG